MLQDPLCSAYITQEAVNMMPKSAFFLMTFGLAILLVHGETTTKATPTCLPNQTYKTCGSRCPANCSHYDPPPACDKACHAGCFCNEGFLLDETRSECIEEEKCRSCEGNTTYITCGSSCPRSCGTKSNTNITCTTECITGCQCKKGYVLLGDKKGTCVLPKDCPSVGTS
ncbi:serine protease inhibitor swm-1-like [Mantella aurantiaca]